MPLQFAELLNSDVNKFIPLFDSCNVLLALYTKSFPTPVLETLSVNISFYYFIGIPLTFHICSDTFHLEFIFSL